MLSVLAIPGVDTALAIVFAATIWTLGERLIKPAKGGRPAY